MLEFRTCRRLLSKANSENSMSVDAAALAAAQMAADQAFAHVAAPKSKKSSPNGSPTSSRSKKAVVQPPTVCALLRTHPKAVRASGKLEHLAERGPFYEHLPAIEFPEFIRSLT